MALKPDRDYQAHTDIAYFWDAALVTAERGGVAALKTAGSGVSLDDANNVVTYAVNPSGAVAKGILVQDVVNVDLTRTHVNFYKNETVAGRKVTLVRKGWIVTNAIIGTPVAGNPAYLGASGNIAVVQAAGAPAVGKFETTKDADGYAKVSIDL